MKVLDFIICGARYSAKNAGPLLLVLLSTMFLYSGVLLPESIPEELTSVE